MIKSWADSRSLDIFESRFVRGMAHDIQRRAELKLKRLDAAARLDDLRVPVSNRLEKLHGSASRWSVRINDQWRITFDWVDGNAYGVLVQDYH